MKLLIITSSFPTGPTDAKNAGVFVRDLAERLCQRGHQVTVLTPQSVEPGDAPYAVETIPWIGGESSLTHLNPKRPLDAARLGSVVVAGAARARWSRRRARPDRVIALWAVPSGLLARIATVGTKTPFDVWALGSDIWRIDDYPMGPKILAHVLASADRLMADGVELAEDVERIAKRSCAFAPSSRLLPPASDQAPPAAAPVNGPFRILAVGRFHEHKGIDVLMQAVALLPADVRARLTVDIFGGGPDEAALRSLLDEQGLHDVVRLHGFIGPQELSDQLAITDVAVIPSRLESIPLILHDYASTQTPLIVTDTGDMGRLVSNYEAGAVVAAGEAVALRDAIEEAVRSGAPGSTAGRAQLAAHLGLDRSIKHLESSN